MLILYFYTLSYRCRLLLAPLCKRIHVCLELISCIGSNLREYAHNSLVGMIFLSQVAQSTRYLLRRPAEYRESHYDCVTERNHCMAPNRLDYEFVGYAVLNRPGVSGTHEHDVCGQAAGKDNRVHAELVQVPAPRFQAFSVAFQGLSTSVEDSLIISDMISVRSSV